MGKAKTPKLTELATFSNVFQRIGLNEPGLTDYLGQVHDFKGNWNEYFGNNNKMVLELACGKGDYTLALAQRNPAKNFIGADIKGPRIWKGAKLALHEKLVNVAFIRIQIEHLEYYFAPGEVSEIWITFPDPFPTKRQAKKRLTSPRFLNIYKQVCEPGAAIHLKTDDDLLFSSSIENVKSAGLKIDECIPDVYKKPCEDEIRNIKTFYEKQHLLAGKKIKYLKFRV